MSGPTPTPVFIGGYPRSGTTLLVALLDGHPDLVVLPEETQFLKDASRRSFTSVDEAVDYLFEHSNLRFLDHQRSVGSADALSVGVADYSGFSYQDLRTRTRAYAADAGAAPPRLLESLARAFADTAGLNGGRRFFVEKTPDNQFRMHAAWDWWPTSRLVYLVRDPRDAYRSHASKTVARGGDGPGALPVERFVAGFARSLASGLRHAAARPDLCTIVRYEDLAARPDPEMRRLCAALGIDHHPALETPTKLGRPWTGIGTDGAVGQGVNAARVGAWRDRLGTADVEYIEAYLGKAMLLLGYPLSAGLKTSAEFLRGLRGPLSLRMKTLRALASLYKPVGIVRRSRRGRGR